MTRLDKNSPDVSIVTAVGSYVQYFGATSPFVVEDHSVMSRASFSFPSRIMDMKSNLDSAEFSAIRQQNLAEINRLASEWKRQVLDPKAPYTSACLSRTVDPVFEALLRFGSGAIDLTALPPERVNGVHLAVVLRATLSRKQSTPGWQGALELARKALRRDKLDVAGALAGLA